ncbi:hypothetical protein SKAU_G00108640 [Synaphobranchus kaupii]|uniref:Protein bassoon n=1 Tax=Synaphobranchus kaupii TaxID=118154 RepID=A0A9Q1G124_SYNKA|nr:hypothetical protein SKAU_G00108640 [Synaphobranchus kaupii]
MQPAEMQQDKGPIHPVSEAQRHQRTTEKDKTQPKMEKDAETKQALKTGAPEQITVTTPVKDVKRAGDSQRSRYHDETNKSSTQDLSRSPQSLSDTGYSSDGISSSHSEITGLIQEEEMKLSERGLSEHSPPSPSEITKLESSMRPLLESKSIPDQEQERGRGRLPHDPRDIDDKKQRPRSLSITPEAFDSDEELEDILEEDEDPDWENQHDLRNSVVESADDFSSKLRHDYVEDSSESGLSHLPGRPRKQEPEMTDEEFMRRQILEMSADEDNEEEEDEDYSYQKPKKSHKHGADSGKEKQRRLTHHSSSFEEESKGADDAYEGAGEDGDEDLMASQGGLRRFKTIELNNTSSYNRDMELSTENDLSLDREPELEMESLTGSPDERSRGEYSSTLPATTPSYTSGTSPTSVSSMEDDSDSSPSRRQRLEEAKQQRKARHRSHGPLLPTIEDSSEEDELREEEELLREQEKMREVEQQRIRSTARKTKRDKEELRAQRRRERSKTPPSNLSPIEDASPTEELRQAAEMEELHRSSCSEYSPSIDSEAEGFEISSKLYKSGSEYNLPTFMSLYSPTEKPSTASSSSSSGKPLKSAEEVYEEMMRKAEMLQKQQKQQAQHSALSPALSHEMYGASGLPLELKSKPPIINLSAVKPQVMVVQMDTAAHGAPVSQLVKPEEPQDAMDLTGQIKAENQTKNDPSLYGSGDLAMDLSTMKQAYDGSYLSMGMQYGSYTDLRVQGDVMGQPLPMRRKYDSCTFGKPHQDASCFSKDASILTGTLPLSTSKPLSNSICPCQCTCLYHIYRHTCLPWEALCDRYDACYSANNCFCTTS